MISALHHVQIDTADIATAVNDYQMLLDTPARWRGDHGGAASAVFWAGNHWVWLRENAGSEGLTGACFRTTDAAQLRRRLKRLAIVFDDTGAPPTLLDSDGLPVERACLAADPRCTRGLHFSFTDAPPPSPAPGSGVLGADHVVISSSGAEGTAFLLAAQLGLDLRADINRPEWRGRLLFFRCGDLILEVFEPSGEKRQAADGWYGITWRVPDIDATRARLAAAGFDLSPVRDGRKPGTRVATVRNRTAGVATLLLQPPR